MTIYNIIGAEKVANIADHVTIEGTVRWGFFQRLEDARDVVMNNMTDLYEGCYNYMIIEAQEEGIAQIVPNSIELYKYNRTTNQYLRVMLPDGFDHVCGLYM